MAVAQPDAARSPLVFRVTERELQLSLNEKESRLLELGARIKTVDGFDPSILKITTVENFHQVRLLALTPGFTSVVLTDEHGASFTIEVLVSGDVKQLEAIIQKAAPGSSVQALKVKDSVLLLGWVDQPGQATKIVELAEQFHPKVLNYLNVSGVQTIMLRVKMMEVQRNKIRALGMNFLVKGKDFFVGSSPGGLSQLGTSSSGAQAAALGDLITPLNNAVSAGASTIPFAILGSDVSFQGFVEALEQESLLKILAEPMLITTNGRPANFLSGGQFPVPIPQGLGTVSIQYKDFGVQLEFVPTVLSSGRLRMQVHPEVSDKDLSNSVVVQGINVPSLTTRRVNTEVEMNFGETLIIAGLMFNRIQARTAKIPFLGDLPWVGAAFRRVSHDEAETELLVMVTPEQAAPVDDGQLPLGPGRNTVSPTARELYINGYLETPRYGSEPDEAMYCEPGYNMPGAAAPMLPPAPYDRGPVGNGAGLSPAPVNDSYFDEKPGATKSVAPPAPTPEAEPIAEPPGAEDEGSRGQATQTSATFPIRKSAGKSSAGKKKPTSKSGKSAVNTPEANSKAPGRASARPGLIAP